MSGTDNDGATVPNGNRTVIELLGPSAGGIRTHVAALSARLEPYGWTPSIMGPAGVMDSIATQAADVEVPSSFSPASVLRAVRQLRGLADGAAVIHAHGLKAAVVASLACPSIPLVVTVHNTVIDESAGRLASVKRVVERRVLRHADRVILISDEMVAQFDGLLAPESVHVIYPASEPKRARRDRPAVRAAYGIDDHAPLVTCVARLHPQKNLPMLFEAVAMVRSAVPAVRLLLVGSGPDAAALRSLAEEMGLSETVVFAGQQPWPVDEMASADVVALSSLWEGSPVAAVEALRLGCPLVTTAVGSLPEYLVDGENARLVDSGDTDAFAAALIEVLSDPTAASRMGRAGQVTADTIFDAAALTRSVADVYNEVGR